MYQVKHEITEIKRFRCHQCGYLRDYLMTELVPYDCPACSGATVWSYSEPVVDCVHDYGANTGGQTCRKCGHWEPWK